MRQLKLIATALAATSLIAVITGCASTPVEPPPPKECKLAGKTKKDFMDVVACEHHRNISKIKECGEAEFDRDKKSSGDKRMTSAFLWHPDGKISKLNVNGEITKDAKVCLAKMYKEFKLPPHGLKKPFKTTYPIVFGFPVDAFAD